MSVKSLKVSNFRSFDELDVNLRDFSVLIGANASGKSNFIEIFKFLRDTANHGIKNAISMQGGIEYLRNISLRPTKNLSMEIVYNVESALMTERGDKKIRVDAGEMKYEFSIAFSGSNGSFKIIKDKVTRNYIFYEPKMNNEEDRDDWKKIGTGTGITKIVDGKVKYEFDLPKDSPLDKKDLTFVSDPDLDIFSEKLLIETPYFLALPPMKYFDDILVYDFDPRLPKRATPITGSNELEEDGCNLAIVLKSILEDDRKKEKFKNLISDILPFVKGFGVEKFMDKSLFFTIKERYNKDVYLPASLLSDGTITITALLIALFFEKNPYREKSFVIFEEPVRNIHPSLISKIVGLMKEVVDQKQIIVTTHNPQIVKHADLEDIMLISRNDAGFSVVSRPIDREDVITFLEHEIGIDELFVKGLLGG